MGRRKRALVVDQDPLVRLAVDRQLETLGWEAVTVNTAREAIRVVELQLYAEVILTELHLPDLDGLSVAWLVTRWSPATRVAFMAAETPSQWLEPKDAPLLLKPFSTTALERALLGAILMPRSGPRLV